MREAVGDRGDAEGGAEVVDCACDVVEDVGEDAAAVAGGCCEMAATGFARGGDQVGIHEEICGGLGTGCRVEGLREFPGFDRLRGACVATLEGIGVRVEGFGGRGGSGGRSGRGGGG